MKKKMKKAIVQQLQWLLSDDEFSVKELRKIFRFFKKKPRKILQRLLNKSLKQKVKAEDDTAAKAENHETTADAAEVTDADQQTSTTADAG